MKYEIEVGEAVARHLTEIEKAEKLLEVQREYWPHNVSCIELYRVVSEIQEFEDHKEVQMEWVHGLRKRPLALDYRMVIIGYDPEVKHRNEDTEFYL